jgi:hypothetical protein
MALTSTTAAGCTMQAEIKPKLSPEEARKAAEEKLQQAKEKRQVSSLPAVLLRSAQETLTVWICHLDVS